jgi:CheY-like chemotaxis protein
MAERAPAVAHRGVLTALRAAAVVIIATGLNDVVAGAVPRYEPLYLYLIAVALVVLLDGVLLGALAALVAIAFYALLFLPHSAALSTTILTPLGAAFATVVIAGAIRGFARSRRREPVPEIFAKPSPILLPPPTPVVDNTEVLTAIDTLRGELREAVSDGARAQRAREETARLESALSASRAETEAYAAERERIRGQVAEARTRIETLEAALAAALAETEAERARVAEAQISIGAMESGFAALRTERDRLHEELDRARREAATRDEDIARLESALTAAREEEASLAGRVTELELALSAARADALVHRDEVDALRRALETEHARAIALSGDVNDERTKITALLAELELERGRVTSERALRERLELDATSREDDNLRLRARIDELEQGLAEAAGAVDRGLSDAEAARAEAAELRRAVDAEHVRAGEAEAARQAVEAEFDQKLQTIVTHLAADHETDLGKAVEEREEARAELRSTAMKLSVVQRKMDEERVAMAVKLREHELLRARVAQLESTSPRPRILIVYPDSELRKNARGVLERAGYDVVSAADGLEALRTAIAQRPDVIIADAIMPKMDGRELCQLLKSQEKTARIKVILLTRPGDEPPRGEFPPDEVLRKPVPLETLKATLAALTTR